MSCSEKILRFALLWITLFWFVVESGRISEVNLNATIQNSKDEEAVADDEGGSGEDFTGSIFAEWSGWSRCSPKCKQMRTRRCLSQQACRGKIQKHIRACHSSSCRHKLLSVEPNDEGRGRPSKFRIMLHLQQYIYTQWSSWAPCSESCHTTRYRSCKFANICGKDPVEEVKACYTKGGHCEKKYLEIARHSYQHLSVYNDLNETDSLRSKHPLDYQECGVAEVSADLRIIGGRRAAKDSWPWQVVILNRFREPFCGGVLLSPQWALTAAHCVRRRLWIRAGEHDLSELEGTEQEQKVVHSFVHPGYDSSTVEFDLALLRLRSPLTIDRHVRPACLPEEGDELPPYARATILGWGKRRNEASFGTDTLHQAEVPVIPLDECRISYEDLFISENMICAGFDVGRVDSCAGDSGGPLLHKRDDGAWTIYGVTSFGDGCGQEGKFGVYTSVARCIEWIRHIMQIQLL